MRPRVNPIRRRMGHPLRINVSRRPHPVFHPSKTFVTSGAFQQEVFLMASIESEMQARLLAQALPFMQKYENKTIVVKYGGHATGETAL